MKLAEHCVCILDDADQVLRPCWAHQEYPDCGIAQFVKKGGVGRVSLGAQGESPTTLDYLAPLENGPWLSAAAGHLEGFNA